MLYPLILLEWIKNNGSIHDFKILQYLANAARKFYQVLAYPPWERSWGYYYTLEVSFTLHVIDTDEGRSIVNELLNMNREIGIDFRNVYR